MKTIGIYLGKYLAYGEKHWDENTVYDGIGGSETWAYEVGKKLANRGYDVTMYADPAFDHDPIKNFHLVSYTRYLYDVIHREYDYFIYSRFVGIDVVTPYLKCHNVYAILHDICAITPTNITSQIGLSKIKKYGYLSDWHKEYLLSIYKNIGLTENRLFKLSNGYSAQYYTDVDLNNKCNAMVWSSSLTRGFNDFYEYVFFPLLNKIADLKLYVCTGTLASTDEELLKKANLLPGVQVLGVLSKKELAEYQKKSKIWIYPGGFPETFCITAIENANAGNVIISPLSYGLSTTLKDIKYLQDKNFNILNKENSHEYIDFISNILVNDDERIKLAKECQNACKNYSWDRATDEIIDMIENDNTNEYDLYENINSLNK